MKDEKKRIEESECNHKNYESKPTMSFIFYKCKDCGKEWNETNRDPAIYNHYNTQQYYR